MLIIIQIIKEGVILTKAFATQKKCQKTVHKNLLNPIVLGDMKYVRIKSDWVYIPGSTPSPLGLRSCVTTVVIFGT